MKTPIRPVSLLRTRRRLTIATQDTNTVPETQRPPAPSLKTTGHLLQSSAAQCASAREARDALPYHAHPGNPLDAPAPRQYAHPTLTPIPVLPRHITSFIGREREIQDIRALLDSTPLVTLTGAAGVGKTRLALEVVSRLAHPAPTDIRFVDLAPITDPSLVASAVLTSVGATELPGQPAATSLLHALANRHALILLDNCEHLVEPCAHLVDALIQRCPSARVLATSREPLAVAGEVVWRVPSLAVPDPENRQSLERFERYETVRLFLDRARAADPHFSLDATSGPAVALICHRLDGIPLAIELAAARVRVLSAPQIASRLDDRFRLLTTSSRTALPRHQTLRALLDWSHDLLTEPEQTLFRRLAVFPASFVLDAAEAVCSDEHTISPPDVLDLLTGLVDKSLVVLEDRGEERRYRLLESLRQYAEEKLRDAGEDTTLRDRHLDWCIALAAAPHQFQPVQDSARFDIARARFEAEVESVRAALAWGATAPHRAARALAIISRYSFMSIRPRSEAIARAEALLATAPERTRTRAGALLFLDHHKRQNHDFAGAVRAAQEAAAIAQEIGDEALARQAASRVALAKANLGDVKTAAAELERLLDQARQRDSDRRVEQLARDLGVVSLAAGDLPRARAALTESREVGQRHASPFATRSRMLLTVADRLAGDLRAARTALEALREERGERRGQSERVWIGEVPLDLALANLARDEGHFLEAHQLLLHLADALIGPAELGQLSYPLCMLGMLYVAAGDPERGATIIAACAPETGPIGTVHVPEVRVEAPLFLARARAALGAARFDAAWTRGRALSLVQALDLARATPTEHAAPSPPTTAARTATSLSPREVQVAALVARGLTNREIAAQLVVTEHTAMRHVEHILNKLGLRSRTEIAAWVVRAQQDAPQDSPVS